MIYSSKLAVGSLIFIGSLSLFSPGIYGQAPSPQHEDPDTPRGQDQRKHSDQHSQKKEGSDSSKAKESKKGKKSNTYKGSVDSVSPDQHSDPDSSTDKPK
jgi:hypothetical protein